MNTNYAVTNCIVTGFSEWVADSKQSPLILLHVLYPYIVSRGTLNLRVVGLNRTLGSGNELSQLIFCLLFTNKIHKQVSQNRERILTRSPAAMLPPLQLPHSKRAPASPAPPSYFWVMSSPNKNSSPRTRILHLIG